MAMKRPAAAGVEPLAKRPATGPVAIITEALDLETSHIAMLAKMAEYTVGCYKDTRHPWQGEVVAWIEQALSTKAEAIQAKIDLGKAKVSDVDGERRRRHEALQEANAAVHKLKGIVEEKTVALKVAEKAREEASGELSSKRVNLKAADKDLVAPTKRKASLEEAKASIDQFKTTRFSKSETKKFAKLGKQFGFDDTMLSSLTKTLSKDPSDRSEFDGVILQQFEDAHAKALTQEVAAIEAAEATRSERTAAVESAEKGLMTVDEAQLESSNALTAAQKELESGEAAVVEATANVKNFFSDFKVEADAYDAAVKEMRCFRDGALAAFNELKNKETPPPPEEPEAAADAAVGAEEAPSAQEAPAAAEDRR